MKKKMIRNLFRSAFIAVLTVNTCFGQSPTKPEKIDSLLTMLHQQNQFNGNILVAEGGEIILSKSYGLRDEIAKEELDENTIFDLASVSKQFTAMGIVILQGEGKLSFDDEIGLHVPELGMYEGVTIRHLLTHTSGLPDYMRLLAKNWDKTKTATNKDLIKVFETHLYWFSVNWRAA